MAIPKTISFIGNLMNKLIRSVQSVRSNTQLYFAIDKFLKYLKISYTTAVASLTKITHQDPKTCSSCEFYDSLYIHTPQKKES